MEERRYTSRVYSLCNRSRSQLPGVKPSFGGKDVTFIKRCWVNRPAQLVIGAFDEAQLLQRDANALQHGLDHLLVVLHPELQQLPGSLHVVKVGVQVCKQDCYLRIGEWR